MFRQGLAKTSFVHTYQRTPWLSIDTEQRQHRWPFLDFLIAQKRVAYLDYVLVHRLLRNYPDVGQEVALFLCHLTLAAKEGHLCVHVTKEGLNPTVVKLWQNEESHPLSADQAKILTQSILMGAQQVPDSMMTTLDKHQEAFPKTPICCEGNAFYLQRYWIFETLFLKSLNRHLNTLPALELDIEKVSQIVQKLCHSRILLEAQAQAIKQGCLNSLTLVTGGPGTGKTYTAGHLIEVFWQNLTEEQKKTCQIVLAAPTGKAAANLQRSLSRVIANLDGFPTIQAKTLHALLEIKEGLSYQEPKRLNVDLLIIDESSMIDMHMMACLFESLKPGSRLILLGDQHQLPSVQAGSVFVDIIQLQQIYPHLKISCVSLSMCLRVESQSLTNLAQLINQGSSQEVVNYLNRPIGSEIKYFHLSNNKKEAQCDFLKNILPFFPSKFDSKLSPEQWLDLFQSIRLLSPLRKGPFGVEAINQRVWEELSQNISKSSWIAAPIIITANDYRQELFNGETGVLICRLPLQTACAEDHAFFLPRQSASQVRCLPASLLPKYELAYCLSVHKSQGSEFDRIVLVLPEGSELFGREVFYTAITRARKCIEIYGSDFVILKTVMQQGVRLSGIKQRLMAHSPYLQFE